MTVFLTRLVGAPAPAAEIAALRWWPDERRLQTRARGPATA